VNRTPGNISTAVKRDNIDLPAPKSFDEELEALKSEVQEPSVPRIQFRLRALELLKKLYLPQPSLADIRESSIFSWLPIVCGLDGESHALDYSLLTFCVVQVAVTKTGNACVNEALQVYNEALHKLAAELKDYRAGRSDEILAAISVLSTSEVLYILSCHIICACYCSNTNSYSFALQIIPGAHMLRASQKSCVSEELWLLPHQKYAAASARVFELSLYIYPST
jgi:hypothetical protein